MRLRYEPGQVWTYNHRHAEEASRATILRIDVHPKIGNIVHVRVDGVAIKSYFKRAGDETPLEAIEHEERGKKE